MSDLKILSRVLTDEVPGGYRMTMEADDGQIFQAFATENQISDLGRELLGLVSETQAILTPEQELLRQEKSS